MPHWQPYYASYADPDNMNMGTTLFGLGLVKGIPLVHLGWTRTCTHEGYIPLAHGYGYCRGTAEVGVYPQVLDDFRIFEGFEGFFDLLWIQYLLDYLSVKGNNVHNTIRSVQSIFS
jgi:hypothetical protein